MSGASKQDKRKSERRAADLAVRPPEDVGYVAPDPEECEEYEYDTDPTGKDMAMKKDRVKLRLSHHKETYALTEFAIIQQTYHRGRWRDVAVADSSHDDEVHVHYYSQRTGQRVGQPELLMPVTCLDDVIQGYELAHTAIVEDWASNKERWRHA